MKYLLGLILILGIVSFAVAQEFSREFDKIGRAEIEFTQYLPDKSAEAVVMFDLGKSYFVRTNDNFDVVFERTTSIKILTEAGIKWAEVDIPFYREGDIYEKIEELEAWTYNFDNGVLRKTKLNTSDCHDEKLNESWLVRKFAMPEVKPGSIIQYRYKINSQYIFNLRDWEFQQRIPVLYSEYEVKMIPFYTYNSILQCASKYDYQESYIDRSLERQFANVTFQDMVYKYGMKNVPAFRDEEYIASINDYLVKLNFQLSEVNYPNGAVTHVQTTWPDLIKDMLKDDNFGKYIRKSEKLAGDLLDLKSFEAKSPDQRFDTIMSYVKANYSWNKVNAKYAHKSAGEFVKDKVGNAAEVNLFAVGLLNACGIEANPVIISTRNNGKILYDYPFNHYFNYVIIAVNVGGQIRLADATELLSANDRIPPRCINDKGLLIKKDEVTWLSLQTNFSSDKQTVFAIHLSDTSLTAGIDIRASEYFALNYRNNFPTENEKMIQKIEKDGYVLSDTAIVVKNQFNRKKPFQLSYRITDKPDKINNKLYVSPLLREVINNNPLTQPKRNYPVDMIYPERRVYSSTIDIPEGYKVDFLPETLKISNDNFELNYLAMSDGSKVMITFAYQFRKAVYSTDDYSDIKYYFGSIVKKGNEKVVFSKL